MDITLERPNEPAFPEPETITAEEVELLDWVALGGHWRRVVQISKDSGLLILTFEEDRQPTRGAWRPDKTMRVTRQR